MQAVAHFVKTHSFQCYEGVLDLRDRKTQTFSGRVVIWVKQADKISFIKDLTIETVEVAGQVRPFTVDDANGA